MKNLRFVTGTIFVNESNQSRNRKVATLYFQHRNLPVAALIAALIDQFHARAVLLFCRL